MRHGADTIEETPRPRPRRVCARAVVAALAVLAAIAGSPAIAGPPGAPAPSPPEFAVTVDLAALRAGGPGTPRPDFGRFVRVPTDETDPAGGQVVRLDFEFPPGATEADAGFVPLRGAACPDEPWGLELWFRAEAKTPVEIEINLRDAGDELWVYTPPGKSARAASGWRRLRVPLSWFRVITWDRVDGRLDARTLESLSFRLYAEDRQDTRTGSLCLGSVRLLDARMPAPGISQEPFTLLDLDNAYDSDAVAFASAPRDGDFHAGEWEHRTLPAEYWPRDRVTSCLGIPFRMPDVSDGRDNHIRCNGQKLVLDSGKRYAALYCMATGKFGPQSGDVTLVYTDGSRQQVLLHISDWTNGPHYRDETAITFPHVYHDDKTEPRKAKLYVQSVRVDPQRVLQAILLPSNDYEKVFALTLYEGPTPPKVGALETRSLTDAFPRYAMKPLEELRFDGPARSAGVFGGYLFRRPYRWELDEPVLNGALVFAADAGPLKGEHPEHRLIWDRFNEDASPLVLGSYRPAARSTGKLESDLLDWTCIRYTCELTRSDQPFEVAVYASRAFPAALYDTMLDAFAWRDGTKGGETRVAFGGANGRPTAHAAAPGASWAAPEEPWMLVWHSSGRGRDFDVPMLLVLESKPDRIEAVAAPGGGIEFAFRYPRAAGKLAVMPLFGIRQIGYKETQPWAEGLPEDVARRCRTWAGRLQCFPVSVAEHATVDEASGTVTVSNESRYLDMASAWGYPKRPVALLPPVASLAKANGYDVAFLDTVEQEDCDTFWGPMTLAEGGRVRYRMPLPRYVTHMVAPPQVTQSPLAQRMADELRGIVDTETSAGLARPRIVSDACGDMAELRALAPSDLALGPAPQRLAYCRRAAENVLDPCNLQVEKEPFTGQYYLMDGRFWAANTDFDKEWANGYVLQGLWNYAYYGEDDAFLKTHWDRIRGLYRYYQIVFDWATCSTYTLARGMGANSDGVHIAWEGMLAMGRMARQAGDEVTFKDVCVRSAHQMMSLYACWFAPAWAADHNYAMEQNRRIRPEQAERGFTPDNLWVELYTCNVSHLDDFFQVTHAFYMFNLGHLLFLRDSGLDELRLRDWIYTRVPELHPGWRDGNAWCAGSGRYYGNDHTMAHFIVRALVFHEDTERLYDWYRECVGDTRASREWYKPGPWSSSVLTALLTGDAPMVVAPVTAYQVVENRFAAEDRKHHIRLRAKAPGRNVLYVRCWKMPVVSVAVNGAGQPPAYDAKSDYLAVTLSAELGETVTVDIAYGPAEQAAGPAPR